MNATQTTLTFNQFKAIIANQFPFLEGEFSERNGRFYFTTYRTLSGYRCTEYSVIYNPNNGRWYVGTPFGGCGRHSLETALEAANDLFGCTP